MSTAITEETKVQLRDWARSKNAVAALWLFGSRARGDHRPDSDFDLALELKPKEGNHDWAFGDYVFMVDEWKAEIKMLIKSEISMVAFRDDLEGRFDPTEGGTRLWP